MELVLRCEVDDIPGRLAILAGVIGDAGGDIQAVDVVGKGGDGRVLDDVIVVGEPEVVRAVVDAVAAADAVRLIHAGPSRGHPGDAVTRLAVGLEALFSGSADFDRGLRTLVSGLLQASSVGLVAAGQAPEATRRRLVLPLDSRVLVVARDYPFTDAELDRARSLVRLCLLAAGVGVG